MSDSLLKNSLYRNPAKGKVFGVCAGIAEAFDWDAWAVRTVVLVVGFLTGFGLVVIAYLIAFFVLDPKPSAQNNPSEESYHRCGERFKDRVEEAKQTFRKPKTEFTSESAVELEQRLLSVKKRIETIEAFVTSEKYILSKEFERMQKEG